PPADTHFVAIAPGPGSFAVSAILLSGDGGAFGDYTHGVGRAAVSLVPGEQGQQDVEIGRYLGDDRAVDLGKEAGEQRRFPAAPAEQLDDADPFVAPDRRAQRVDRFDRAADRRRESD